MLSCKAHHSWSMYVCKIFTPFPFIPLFLISALDMAAVPTATGALKQRKVNTDMLCLLLYMLLFYKLSNLL